MTDLLQKDWYVLQNGMCGSLGYNFVNGWEFTPYGDKGVVRAKVFVSIWNCYKAIGIGQFVNDDCVYFVRTLFKLDATEDKPNQFKMIYFDTNEEPNENRIYNYLDIVYYGDQYE